MGPWDFIGNGALGSGLDLTLRSAMGIAPYGLRYGGDVPLNQNPMPKGLGYFGSVPNQQGGSSTEISGDGVPLMVPTLTPEELRGLLSGAEPTNEIYRKANEHAAGRISSGLGPFAGPQDLRIPFSLFKNWGYK